MRRICQVAGAQSLIDDTRVGLAQHGVIAAIRRHDTPVIFDWLLDMVSYQGVSDSIAYGYMERHGRARWHDITNALVGESSCPKLTCYWAFEVAATARARGRAPIRSTSQRGPLPRHDLRNGRLNQTAYSLFLFMRDLAGSDIVAWIDERLGAIDLAPAPDRAARLRQALLDPLGHIYACRTSCCRWRCSSCCSLAMRSSRPGSKPAR